MQSYRGLNMIITSAQYYKDNMTGENSCINAVIDGNRMSVPIDPANRHYQAIQEWAAEGNKIEDAD
tara:strand:+ start:385 stop:582 length:198 start_codon:yes stop_codon:yes gene_type:complete